MTEFGNLLPSFDQMNRAPMEALFPPPTAPISDTIVGGLTRVEYSKRYPHKTHLADEVGVFNSQCPGCRKHFAEAFGPSIADLMTRLAGTNRDAWWDITHQWLEDVGADIVDAEIVEDDEDS